MVGAGAAGIACANFYVSLGVKRENIWMFDSKGLIHKGRQDKLHPTKAAFAQEKDATLAEAMQGAMCSWACPSPVWSRRTWCAA